MTDRRPAFEAAMRVDDAHYRSCGCTHSALRDENTGGCWRCLSRQVEGAGILPAARRDAGAGLGDDVMADYPGVPIGLRITALRTAAGMSLSQLARKAGMSRSGLWQIEKGESSPSYDTILKIGMALETPPAELTDARFAIEERKAVLEETYSWISEG